MCQVRLDRFSPFHVRPDRMAFTACVRPGLFLCVSAGQARTARLAYFFDFDYADNRQPASYVQPLQRAVQVWWKDWTDRDSKPAPRPARFDDGTVVITDTRAVARARALNLPVWPRVYSPGVMSVRPFCADTPSQPGGQRCGRFAQLWTCFRRTA